MDRLFDCSNGSNRPIVRFPPTTPLPRFFPKLFCVFSKGTKINVLFENSYKLFGKKRGNGDHTFMVRENFRVVQFCYHNHFLCFLEIGSVRKTTLSVETRTLCPVSRNLDSEGFIGNFQFPISNIQYPISNYPVSPFFHEKFIWKS